MSAGASGPTHHHARESQQRADVGRLAGRERSACMCRQAGDGDDPAVDREDGTRRHPAPAPGDGPLGDGREPRTTALLVAVATDAWVSASASREMRRALEAQQIQADAGRAPGGEGDGYDRGKLEHC